MNAGDVESRRSDSVGVRGEMWQLGSTSFRCADRALRSLAGGPSPSKLSKGKKVQILQETHVYIPISHTETVFKLPTSQMSWFLDEPGTL